MKDLRLCRCLKVQRDRLGWSQQGVADTMGAKQNTYTFWESGDRLPGPEFIPEIARFLDMEIRDVLYLIWREQYFKKRNGVNQKNVRVLR